MNVNDMNAKRARTGLLDGAPNFRDIGGYLTGDGHVVRHGYVYRSETLSRLSEGDQERLRDLGIRTVFDLRAEFERRRSPSRVHREHDVEFHPLDISADLRAGADRFWSILRADRSSAGTRRAMLEIYREMPRAFENSLPVLFDRLLGEGGVPAVIHCHAGKDRTGFAVAMLLSAIGVPRTTIYDDYTMTDALGDAEAAAAEMAAMIAEHLGSRADPESAMPMVVANPDYLDCALQSVVAGFGSVDRYLRAVGRLDDDKRSMLCALLLEPTRNRQHDGLTDA